jgi:cupin fold WbuC family metalloprotein
MPAHPLALPSPKPPYFCLQDHVALWDEGIATSRVHSRHRIMWPLQRHAGDTVQRLLNFIQPAAYFRPHRHPTAHATELIYLLQGALSVFIFNDNGNILRHTRLSTTSPLTALVDIDAGLWHTILAHDPDTVILEIKKGPYDAATDKIFAPWAPEESPLPESYASFQDHLRHHAPI